MFFKPPSITKMWDTWMYLHDGTYYLYYLVTERSPGEGVWLSTSRDGIHWQELGLVLPMAEDAQWLGTGAVWPSRVPSEENYFVMNFSEWRGPTMREGQQTIFFATSKDLVTWTRLDGSYEFLPDTRWYRKDEGNNSRWDCIYPLEKTGGYYGYWTANPKDFQPGFGFGETTDGLHWQALPPPTIDWGDTPVLESLEFGAIAKVEDRYYAMLGCYPVGGMFQFTADTPHGPFAPAKHNFNFLVSPKGHRMAYFSRFFPTPEALLVNHHVITRSDERFFAPLKTATLTKGELQLCYWPRNDLAKGPQQHHAPTLDTNAEHNGVRLLEPTLPQNGSFVECKVRHVDEGSIGLYLEHEDAMGTLVRMSAQGVVEIGTLNRATMTFHQEEKVDRQLDARDYEVRMLVRGSLLELYLNDVFIQCFSMPAKGTGKLGFLFEKTTVTVSDFYIYPMNV
jgi:hypothetical protein